MTATYHFDHKEFILWILKLETNPFPALAEILVELIPTNDVKPMIFISNGKTGVRLNTDVTPSVVFPRYERESPIIRVSKEQADKLLKLLVKHLLPVKHLLQGKRIDWDVIANIIKRPPSLPNVDGTDQRILRLEERLNEKDEQIADLQNQINNLMQLLGFTQSAHFTSTPAPFTQTPIVTPSTVQTPALSIPSTVPAPAPSTFSPTLSLQPPRPALASLVPFTQPLIRPAAPAPSVASVPIIPSTVVPPAGRVDLPPPSVPTSSPQPPLPQSGESIFGNLNIGLKRERESYQDDSLPPSKSQSGSGMDMSESSNIFDNFSDVDWNDIFGTSNFNNDFAHNACAYSYSDYVWMKESKSELVVSLSYVYGIGLFYSKFKLPPNWKNSPSISSNTSMANAFRVTVTSRAFAAFVAKGRLEQFSRIYRQSLLSKDDGEDGANFRNWVYDSIIPTCTTGVSMPLVLLDPTIIQQFINNKDYEPFREIFIAAESEIKTDKTVGIIGSPIEGIGLCLSISAIRELHLEKYFVGFPIDGENKDKIKRIEEYKEKGYYPVPCWIDSTMEKCLAMSMHECENKLRIACAGISKQMKEEIEESRMETLEILSDQYSSFSTDLDEHTSKLYELQFVMALENQQMILIMSMRKMKMMILILPILLVKMLLMMILKKELLRIV